MSPQWYHCPHKPHLLMIIISRSSPSGVYRDVGWVERKKTIFENSRVHWDSNSQTGNSLGSVRVHSLALSYTLENMRCDSRASLLAFTLASPCLGREPKARVVTLVLYNLTIVLYDYKMKNVTLNIQWLFILNNSMSDMTKGPLIIWWVWVHTKESMRLLYKMIMSPL